MLQTAQEDALLLAAVLEYGRMLESLRSAAEGTPLTAEERKGLDDRAAQCSEAVAILRRRNT